MGHRHADTLHPFTAPNPRRTKGWASGIAMVVSLQSATRTAMIHPKNDSNLSDGVCLVRAWQLNGIGLGGLQLTDLPAPVVGAKEIQVRIRAVSLNYRDWEILSGTYPGAPSLPLVLASDAAGEVVATGSQVSRFKQGDRDIGTFRQYWTDGGPTATQLSSILGGPLPGVLAEYVLLHEEEAVAAPGYVSYVEASTLPLAAVTSWNALVEDGPVLPNETVLVQGSGRVSIFALQIAKAAGARVIALSISD
jgi:NADPH:quinone reductase-like Zn-dependent oxidoreductase